MIQLQGLKKSFVLHHERLDILNIGSWTVKAGERLALLGPSGCGKSTLLHLLSGILMADAGELNVCGRALHRMREAERDRFRAANIGYIMQDFHLIGSLSARQNVELSLNGIQKGAARRQWVESWFSRVGLEDRMNHLPGQLSRGQQQRVAIIRALINKPKLVLADEPTGSLDWETAGETMRLLLELCKDEGLTLVAVTHDQQLAQLFPSKIQVTDINTSIRLTNTRPLQALEGGIRA